MLEKPPMQDVLRGLLQAVPTCDDSVLTTDRDQATLTAASSVPASATISSLDSSSCQRAVATVAASSLTYSQFVDQYMAPNLPVLIKGACSDWPALRTWSTAGGAVNMDHLTAIAGHCNVAVTDTARQHQGCGPCTSMSFEQYSNWWNQRPQDHHQHHNQHIHQQKDFAQQQQQQQQRDARQRSSTPSSVEDPACLYLKDWHFVAEFPEQQVYTTPQYFQEDWLNEYLDYKINKRKQQHKQHHQQQLSACTGAQQQDCGCADGNVSNGYNAVDHGSTSNKDSSSSSSVTTSDYRFVYCGPCGSWTPVHSDVLRSYSWSANVAGRKRWWLLPPQYTHLLQDTHRQICTDFFTTEPQDVTRQQQWQQHLMEVQQGVGDVLFVPSGWFHMVVNEVDTLSINHNWINAYNIHWSWRLLQHEHQLATQQLEDCRETATAEEFEGLVQKLLAANSGFDFEQMADLLTIIVSRRMRTVEQLLQQQESGQLAAGAADAQQLQQRAEVVTAAVVSTPELESCSTEERTQIQLLHCALDLKRASDVLQELQHAYVAALERNQAWCLKQKGKQDMLRHSAVTTVQPVAQVHVQLKEVQSDPSQLPTWVTDAITLVSEARGVVETLAR